MKRPPLRIAIAALCLFAACEMPAADGPQQGKNMQLQIGNKTWTVTLENNAAAHAFSQRLPFSAEMTELNGNEKYVYLDQPLPSNPQKIGTIRTGDVMLFGDNCLVLFYRDFSSSYRYTRLGRVSAPSGLARHVGSGPISVSFLSE